MATIKDVARLAGVSTSTVSRVLNKGTGSEDVVERVRKAAEELDYSVNISARGLVQRYASFIGVIVADISNPPISQMFHGISNQLHRRNFTVMLGNSESDPEQELELLRMFAVQGARGVIYTGPSVSDFLATALNEFPAPVVVAAQDNPLLEWPAVLFDNCGAAMTVTEVILRAGHRRAAFIAGPMTDHQAGVRRRDGYLAAMKSAGAPVPDHYVQSGPFSIRAGYDGASRILAGPGDRPTAIFGASDLIAIGAIRCLRDQGLSVPEDVAVFGFDNIPVGTKLIPTLSTVELDFYELGEVCADVLLRLFDRESSQLSRVMFGHRLVFRESFPPVGAVPVDAESPLT